MTGPRPQITFASGKRCARCGEDGPACGFGRNRYRLDGLADYCARCGRLGHKATYARRKARETRKERRVVELRDPEAVAGFPCGALGCEDSFTTAEILECHRKRWGHRA